jgi:hypothetical protein
MSAHALRRKATNTNPVSRTTDAILAGVTNWFKDHPEADPSPDKVEPGSEQWLQREEQSQRRRRHLVPEARGLSIA